MNFTEKKTHIKNILTVQIGRIAEYIESRNPMLDSGMFNLLKKTADDAKVIMEVLEYGTTETSRKA